MSDWEKRYPSTTTRVVLHGDVPHSARAEGRKWLQYVKHIMRLMGLDKMTIRKVLSDGSLLQVDSFFGHDQMKFIGVKGREKEIAIVDTVVGVMVTAHSPYDLDQPFKIYFKPLRESMEYRYVELPTPEQAKTRYYGCRYLRVVDGDPFSGMLVISCAAYTPSVNDKHYVILFRVDDKVEPVVKDGDYYKYNVTTKIIELDAMVNESSVLNWFQTTFTHPNRNPTEGWSEYEYYPPREWIYWYPDGSTTIMMPCDVPDRPPEMPCYITAYYYPASHWKVRDPNNLTMEVQYQGSVACMGSWFCNYDPWSVPCYGDFTSYQYNYSDYPTPEISSQSSNYFLDGKARIDIIGGRVYWSGPRENISNLKYKVCGKIESFIQARLIFHYSESRTGAYDCPAWEDFYQSGSVNWTWSPTIMLMFIVEAEGDSWREMENVLYDNNSLLFPVGSFIDLSAQGTQVYPAFQWNQWSFTSYGRLSLGYLAYNINECFYTDDNRRILTISATYVGLNAPSMKDLIYYKIDDEKPVKVAELSISDWEYWYWWNNLRNNYPISGGVLYDKKMGDGGGSFKRRRVMFQTAGQVQVYIVNNNVYYKTREQDWSPSPPPMKQGIFVNRIGPMAREILIAPGNISGIVLEEYGTYLKYYRLYGEYMRGKRLIYDTGSKIPPLFSSDYNRSYGTTIGCTISDFNVIRSRRYTEIEL